MVTLSAGWWMVVVLGLLLVALIRAGAEAPKCPMCGSIRTKAHDWPIRWWRVCKDCGAPYEVKR